MSELRTVLYMAHPLRPTPEQLADYALYPEPVAAALAANVKRAMRWLSWLRRTFSETTFVAPWIAAVLSGEDDSDPAQREAGLVDAAATIPLLDGVVLVGGRASAGMEREAAANAVVFDLTPIGVEPPGTDVERSLFGWLDFARDMAIYRRTGGFR